MAPQYRLPTLDDLTRLAEPHELALTIYVQTSPIVSERAASQVAARSAFNACLAPGAGRRRPARDRGDAARAVGVRGRRRAVVEPVLLTGDVPLRGLRGGVRAAQRAREPAPGRALLRSRTARPSRHHAAAGVRTARCRPTAGSSGTPPPPREPRSSTLAGNHRHRRGRRHQPLERQLARSRPTGSPATKGGSSCWRRTPNGWPRPWTASSGGWIHRPRRRCSCSRRDRCWTSTELGSDGRWCPCRDLRTS